MDGYSYLKGRMNEPERKGGKEPLGGWPPSSTNTDSTLHRRLDPKYTDEDL